MSLCLEKLCRTCMIEAPAMLSLFCSSENNALLTNSASIFEMLTAVTTLQISKNDGLPENICISCLSDINRAYSFKQKSERSELTLKAYLEQISSNSMKHEQVLQDLCEFADLLKTTENESSTTSLKEAPFEDGNTSMIEKEDSITESFQDDDELLADDTIIPIVDIPHDTEEDDEHCTFYIVFECGICLEQFERKCDQKEHMSEKHSAVHCEKCDEFFESDIFSKHLMTHSKFVEELPSHPTTSTNDDEHVLLADSVRLETNAVEAHQEPELKKDADDETPEMEFKCSKCNAKFAKQRSLRLHQNSNKCTEAAHECGICKKVFARKRNLAQHMLVQHEQKLKCSECPKEFSRQDRLNLHMQDHKGLKKHNCLHCGKGFNMLSTLKDHVRTHNGEKPFLCSICGKGFSQSTNMKQHLRRHNQIKPFQCESCNNSFVSKGELESHLRTHTGEHPFICDICGSGFTTSSSMVKHRRIHTGEKPYKCNFCPMRFTALGTLKNHRRTHTGERPYACPICDRKFTQKSDMVSHTKVHSVSRPHICTICHFGFTQPSTLKTHMKTHQAYILKAESSGKTSDEN